MYYTTTDKEIPHGYRRMADDEVVLQSDYYIGNRYSIEDAVEVCPAGGAHIGLLAGQTAHNEFSPMVRKTGAELHEDFGG